MFARDAFARSSLVIAMPEYTQESLNEFYHAAVLANASGDPAIISHSSGHLLYEKRQGIRRIEITDCHFCVEQGLNDDNWHNPKEIKARMGAQ